MSPTQRFLIRFSELEENRFSIGSQHRVASVPRQVTSLRALESEGSDMLSGPGGFPEFVLITPMIQGSDVRLTSLLQLLGYQIASSRFLAPIALRRVPSNFSECEVGLWRMLVVLCEPEVECSHRLLSCRHVISNTLWLQG